MGSFARQCGLVILIALADPRLAPWGYRLLPAGAGLVSRERREQGTSEEVNREQ